MKLRRIKLRRTKKCAIFGLPCIFVAVIQAIGCWNTRPLPKWPQHIVAESVVKRMIDYCQSIGRDRAENSQTNAFFYLQPCWKRCLRLWRVGGFFFSFLALSI